MALEILSLPVEYEVPPFVADVELEDLLLQVQPELEDGPEDDLRVRADSLRPAVEAELLGYRQSQYLAAHFAEMPPHQQLALSETIVANLRKALACAQSQPPLTPALELFVANMREQ